jgi:hypothetical protein
VSRSVTSVEITVVLPEAAEAGLADGAMRTRRVGDELSVTLAADVDVDAWIVRAHAAGAKIMGVAPRHETLEDLFVRQVANADRSRTEAAP